LAAVASHSCTIKYNSTGIQIILNQQTIIPPQKATEVNNLFPVFIKLEQMQLLIVGGGNVGLEKLTAVLNNSPATAVTIVAPFIKDELRTLAAKFSKCCIYQKPFEPADLEGKDIVIGATDDKELHKHIRTLAKQLGILVNIADTPELCDFYLSSVVQKGNLKIAISTNGKSPTVAKRIKEVLNHAIPAEMDEVLNNINKIRNTLNGNFDEKIKKLNSITKVMVENGDVEKEKRWKRIASYSVIAFASMLIGYFIFSYLPAQQIGQGLKNLYKNLDSKFPWMLAAGFVAQLIDGALGMGYGVASTTVLLSAGINPAAISSSIHTAEMFASGASGYSHYRFGNVNKKLFKALLIPGVLGAVGGAILLVYIGEKYGNLIRPLLAVYTLFLGLKILLNAFRKQQQQKKFKHYSVLAGAGGFLDSFGGGGWGPIVTTTLITRGRSPKYVIGSVSLTEFFVTLASAFTFFTLLGVSHWQTILGLIVGSVIAAPIAAKLAGKLPRKTSFILLGLLVIFWSCRILVKLF
jgi:uncharacterized protein